MVSLAGSGRDNIVRVKSEIDHCIAKDATNLLLLDGSKLPTIRETSLTSVKVKNRHSTVMNTY